MQSETKYWTLADSSAGGAEVAVESLSFVLERMWRAAEKEIGVTFEIMHKKGGIIICTCGRHMASLTFDPGYLKDDHSTRGFRNAYRIHPEKSEDLLFVDSTATLSTIPARYAIPLVEAMRAIVYIMEFRAYPPFLQWTPPK